MISGGASLMIVVMVVVMIEAKLMIEVMAVTRMHIRAERGGIDVRMRRIERHQQDAEVQ